MIDALAKNKDLMYALAKAPFSMENSNTETSLPQVKLFSDGGAAPNPGKGAFGVILTRGSYKKEFSQGYQLTTNNRMELRGIIFGLEQLNTKVHVEVYTDSKYVVDGIEKGWAKKWKAKNWYRTKTEKAVNADLWAQLLVLIEKHIVRFHWVKGHNGHYENERCDALATAALQGKNLLPDEGYTTDGKPPLTLL